MGRIATARLLVESQSPWKPHGEAPTRYSGDARGREFSVRRQAGR